MMTPHHIVLYPLVQATSQSDYVEIDAYEKNARGAA
jgi:hypothetical protein